jgi:hypothetical protein
VICLNTEKFKEEEEEEVKKVGLFLNIAKGLEKCKITDPEIIILIHKWIMSGIEALIYKLDLDPVEAMTGLTPLRLRSESGNKWITIDIIFKKKVCQRLHLNFNHKPE